jgi:hypothetical protein
VCVCACRGLAHGIRLGREYKRREVDREKDRERGRKRERAEEKMSSHIAENAGLAGAKGSSSVLDADSIACSSLTCIHIERVQITVCYARSARVGIIDINRLLASLTAQLWGCGAGQWRCGAGWWGCGTFAWQARASRLAFQSSLT